MQKHLGSLAYTLIFVFGTLNLRSQWAAIPDTNFGTWLNTNGYSICLQGNNTLGWQMDTTCNKVVGAETMVCTHAEIRSLEGIQYFDSLGNLDCSSNQLTSLPELPKSLLYLQANGNQITSIHSLPPDLLFFLFYHNQLSALPEFPKTVTQIDCSNNNIDSLPILPDSLKTFWCRNNHIKNMPPLHQTSSLDCSNNLLSALPELPDSLYNCIISDNPIQCLPVLKRIVYLQFVNTAIACIPNLGNVDFSGPALNTLPICNSSNNPNSCIVINSLNDLPTETQNVSLVPNPTNAPLFIQTENFSADLISVFDLQGKKMNEQKFAQQIDVSNLSCGSYLIELKNVKGVVARKKFSVVR